MREQVLEREQLVNVPLADAFAFYADARNLEAITPPWLRFRVETPEEIEMAEGAVIDYRLVLHGIPVRWRTRIETWQPPRRFVDTQVKGPYALWHHTHELEERGPDRTLVRDRVRYRIGFSLLGELAHSLVVRSDLAKIFDYRAEATAKLMQAS